MHKSWTSAHANPQAPTDIYSYEYSDNKARKRYYNRWKHSTGGMVIRRDPRVQEAKARRSHGQAQPGDNFSSENMSQKAEPNNHMPIILMTLETKDIKALASQIHELER